MFKSGASVHLNSVQAATGAGSPGAAHEDKPGRGMRYHTWQRMPRRTSASRPPPTASQARSPDTWPGCTTTAAEHDLVFAAFGNDPRAMALHDQILLWLLRQQLNLEVPDLVPDTSAAGDLTPYAGTYRSNQLRVDVRAVDGHLEEKVTYEPLDNAQERIFTGFSGGSFPFSPRRLAPIRKDLFAPAGMPLEAFNGYMRQLLVSYHGVRDGRLDYRCAGGRMTRREHGG